MKLETKKPRNYRIENSKRFNVAVLVSGIQFYL